MNENDIKPGYVYHIKDTYFIHTNEGIVFVLQAINEMKKHEKDIIIGIE